MNSSQMVEQALLFKSIYGIFYKNYNIVTNSDSDSKFLSRVFKGSTLLSDPNKALLYFTLPQDPLLKDKHLP